MTGEAIEIKLPDLGRVALEPGDAILVRVSGGRLSMADCQAIEQRIKLKLPGHEVLIISRRNRAGRRQTGREHG